MRFLRFGVASRPLLQVPSVPRPPHPPTTIFPNTCFVPPRRAPPKNTQRQALNVTSTTGTGAAAFGSPKRAGKPACAACSEAEPGYGSEEQPRKRCSGPGSAFVAGGCWQRRLSGRPWWPWGNSPSFLKRSGRGQAVAVMHDAFEPVTILEKLPLQIDCLAAWGECRGSPPDSPPTSTPACPLSHFQ